MGYSFSSTTRNQHPHHGLDPCRKEEKGCHSHQLQLSANLRGTSTLTTDWTRARERRSAGRRGERPPALSSSSRSGTAQEGEEVQERVEEGVSDYRLQLPALA